MDQINMPPGAASYPHNCPNDVYLLKVGGRDLIYLVIRHKPRGRPEKIVTVRLTPRGFDLIERLFPGAPWSLNNGYASISTHRPDGTPDRFYVVRILDYLRQQGEAVRGTLGHFPTSKGWRITYANGDVTDLTTENCVRAATTPNRGHTEFFTGWAVAWRQECIREGRDPNTLKPGAILGASVQARPKWLPEGWHSEAAFLAEIAEVQDYLRRLQSIRSGKPTDVPEV